MTLTPHQLEQLTQIVPPVSIKFDEPLANHTYFKIGGPAEILVQVNSDTQLAQVYKFAIGQDIPVFVLGSGSNLLISDSGIKGIVIKNRADSIQINRFSGGIKSRQLKYDRVNLKVSSGTITNHLVRYTIDQGLAGLEVFLGLPGTVGGAIYNNSHYKDQLFGDFVVSVDTLDHRGIAHTYTNSQLDFAYDHSRFHQNPELIINAVLELPAGDKTKSWEKATQYAKNRAATQPLSQPSSGCMYKNITQKTARAHNLPTTSVGYLIEQAGLKGAVIGGAKVSEKHANFIVNLGNATAKDVQLLTQKIQSKIKQKYNIELEKEVFFIDNQ